MYSPPPQEARHPTPTTPTDDTHDAGRRMEIESPMHVGRQPSRPRRAAKKRNEEIRPNKENTIRRARRHCEGHEMRMW